MGSIFAQSSQFQGNGGTPALQRRYKAMQAVATREGVPEVDVGVIEQPGFFLRVIDFISRPLYAVAGVADVALGTYETESDKYIVPRIMRELFGRGDKEMFGDVLRQAGIPEGGQLSDLIGENMVTRHFDPTVRGTIALGLDVGLDPLTYFGIGALGKVSAVSRGGRVLLTEAGESALDAVLTSKVGVVAKKLGRLRVDDAATAGARQRAGMEASEMWFEAARQGGEAKGAAMLRIEMEAHDRGLRFLQATANAEHSSKMLLDVARTSADATMERVLSGRGGAKEVRSILEAAGLNPGAANLTDELAKLVEPNRVYFNFPGIKPITLFELGQSGSTSRLINTITDPVTKKVVTMLESNTATREVLAQARVAKESIQKTVHKLFNRDAMGVPHDFVVEKQALFDGINRDRGQLQKRVSEIFGEIKDPKFIEASTRFLDNPGTAGLRAVVSAAEAADIPRERAVHFLREVREQFSVWGTADVSNKVLDAKAYEQFSKRYVPHMIDGWEQVTEQQRALVLDLLEQSTGRRGRGPAATIGRFAEQRYFSTYDELEGFLAKVNADLGLDLKPDFDLGKLMVMRGVASIEAARMTEFLHVVRRKFARSAGLEKAGILASVLPDLKGDLMRRLGNTLDSKDVALLDELMERSSTIGGKEARERIRQKAFEDTASQPERIRFKQLKEQAAELREDAAVTRIKRARAKTKVAGLKEAKERERLVLAERVAQRHRDIALKKRLTLEQSTGGTAQQKLKALQKFLTNETRAITAKEPALRIDVTGGLTDTVDMQELAAELAGKAATKRQRAVANNLTQLVQSVRAARGRIIEELGTDAAELAEAAARQQRYNFDVAKIKYAQKRFGEEAARFATEAHELHAAAQVPRTRSALLEKEARAIRKGLAARKTIADVKAEDLAALRKLPDEAQASFLYQALHNIDNLEHLEAFMGKYEDVFMKVSPDALEAARSSIRQSRLDAHFSPYGAPGHLQRWRTVEIPGAKAGEFERWELPESIAEDLATWDKKWLVQPEVRGLLRLFDMGTNVFKTGVTVLFPAFNFRNGYSNLFQSALDIQLQAFNPQRHLDAVSVMIGGTKAGRRLGIPETTIVDKFGNHYTGAHLRQLAEAYHIKVDFKALAEIIDGSTTMSRRDGLRALKAIRSAADKTTFIGRKGAELIESEARMMHFITLIRRGLSPSDAAMQVKRFLYDYGNLSQAERNIARRVFPFYTWNSKTIRMLVHQITHKPGLVNNLQKPFNRDQGPDSDLLPEYLRGDLRARLEPGPGKVAAFLTGIDLPVNSLDTIFSGSLEKTMRNSLGLLNPLIKAPFEYAFGMEAFTGRPIHGAQHMRKLGPLLAKFPAPIRDYFELQTYEGNDGETRYLANGTKVYLIFKSWALSRIMGTAAEFNQLIQTDESVLDWSKILTGMQIREFDMDEAQKQMLRARYNRLEAEMLKRGLYLEFTKPYVRPDVKAKAQGQGRSIFSVGAA